MTALTATHPTLLNWAKRLDPDGKVDKIAEIIAQKYELMDFLPWVQGNLPTGHRTTVRTGLPSVTWRKLYGGVQPSKSVTAQITDSCGMLEAYAEIDAALAELNGLEAQWRMSEERPFLDSMAQEFFQTLFYGNEGTEPEAFTGLLPRFNSTTAENGVNLIAGGAATGQTDCTSIWLMVLGDNTVHGIFPKGSQAGLRMEDKGRITVENVDGANGRAEMYRTHYRWDAGLTVRDWRYVSRAHSIDISALTKAGTATNDSDLIDLMVQMLEVVPDLNAGTPVFVCNNKIRSMLRRQIIAKTASSTLSMENIAGRHVVTFDGIPVLRCDGIVNTESSLN